MRTLRRSFAAVVLVSCALGACGDDEPAAVGTGSTIAASSESIGGDSGGDASLPPSRGGGDLDCEALKLTLANIGINWQVVIGLTNSPSSDWAQIPLGSITEFGDQVAVANAALGSDAEAAAALSYMSEADAIVERGLGGDAAAQADLTTYLGTDVLANVSKQIPISTAFQNAGCD